MTPRRLGLLAAIWIAYGMWMGWSFPLDYVNLAIHEAGHPLVGMFSSNLMVYGGTLFQLVFPYAFYQHFQRQHHRNGQWFSLMWLSTSLHNMGVYMKDARAKELPLVGGLDPEHFHDWSEIFSRWGLLPYDRFFGMLAIMGAWALWLWVVWQLWSLKNEHPIKEES